MKPLLRGRLPPLAPLAPAAAPRTVHDMTEADALDELALLCAADVAPALTDDELVLCLARARRTDINGLTPDDPAWTPTWNLRAAAYRGWMLKAGKATGHHDFSADGASFSRSQVAAACREQAAAFKPRGIVAVPLRTRADF